MSKNRMHVADVVKKSILHFYCLQQRATPPISCFHTLHLLRGQFSLEYRTIHFFWDLFLFRAINHEFRQSIKNRLPASLIILEPLFHAETKIFVLYLAGKVSPRGQV